MYLKSMASAAMDKAVRTNITGKLVVVTGGSRGIGLGLVKRFLERDNNVIATARQVETAEKLHALGQQYPGKLKLSALDVCNFNSISGWAQKLKDDGVRHVDVLVNNAGVKGDHNALDDTLPEDFMMNFQTNAMGPFFVTQQLHKQGLLGGEQHTLVASISSIMASHQDQTLSSKRSGLYAYRSSKAALGAINKALAMDLGPQNVDCVLLHPGYVKTDLSGWLGNVDVDESSTGMMAVLESGVPMNGRFWSFDGSEIPW